MKTFKNLKVGVLETVNVELAKQYEARPSIYAPVETESKTNEPTLKELKEQADALGIEYKAKVTKAELLEMLANANQE